MRLARVQALLMNYYYFSLNSLDRLFDVFYWPILDILIWGFMTYFISGISEYNVLNTILGGIILWVFVWRTSQDQVVYLLENYWSRNIYHLFASPVRSSELMLSLCLLGLVRSILAFFVLSGLSFLLYSFNVFSFPFAPLALLISLLFLFGWGIGMIVSSLVFRFGTRIQVLAWSTIWIVQPFSCVFYPLSALPEWAASIARILPTTHVFEQLRATIAGEAINWSSMGYAFGFLVIFLIFASYLVTSAIMKARKNGFFAKPE